MVLITSQETMLENIRTDFKEHYVENIVTGICMMLLILISFVL